MERSIEYKVMDMLKFISLDSQLNKNDPDYLGYINCFEDGFLNPDNNEAFKDFVRRPKYYSSILRAFNLDTNGIDLEETIFIIKN